MWWRILKIPYRRVISPVTSGRRPQEGLRRPALPVTVSLAIVLAYCCATGNHGICCCCGVVPFGLRTNGGRHVRPGAMAGSLILVPFYMCVLGLLLCGSVADSRAVFFRARYEASVADETDIDDGPQTFTMQDHLNFLRERELARRERATLSGTLEATSRVEDQESPIFVEDYCLTEANKKDIPKSS